MTKAANYFWLNLVILGVFVADRILKVYFLKNPAKIFGGDFFYGILTFNFAKNYGVAFGLNFNKWLLLGVVTVVLLIVAKELIKAYSDKKIFLATALTLIFVGAISNLIDRLKYGFVVDYIDLKYFTVFNLADSLITVGAGALVWFLVKQSRLDKNKHMV